MQMMTDTSAATTGTNGHDRRRGLRIGQLRPVKVYIPSAGRYIAGRTRDVSAAGLQLELPRGTPLQSGRLLSVYLGSDHDGGTLAHREQMMPARVVWVRSDGQMPTMAGVELLAAVAVQSAA